jgi:hypothetical protein
MTNSESSFFSLIIYECDIFSVLSSGACTAKKIRFRYSQKRNCVASVLNFHFHVSARDLYIPTIGPAIFLQKNRQTDRGNI